MCQTPSEQPWQGILWRGWTKGATVSSNSSRCIKKVIISQESPDSSHPTKGKWNLRWRADHCGTYDTSECSEAVGIVACPDQGQFIGCRPPKHTVLHRSRLYHKYLIRATKAARFSFNKIADLGADQGEAPRPRTLGSCKINQLSGHQWRKHAEVLRK